MHPGDLLTVPFPSCRRTSGCLALLYFGRCWRRQRWFVLYPKWPMSKKSGDAVLFLLLRFYLRESTFGILRLCHMVELASLVRKWQWLSLLLWSVLVLFVRTFPGRAIICSGRESWDYFTVVCECEKCAGKVSHRRSIRLLDPQGGFGCLVNNFRGDADNARDG